MSREPGYHINVAKMKPDVERSHWEKAHGSGYQHYFNVQLGQSGAGVSKDEAVATYEEMVKKYPASEGYSLSLLYVPYTTMVTVSSTHIQVGDHTREVTFVPAP